MLTENKVTIQQRFKAFLIHLLFSGVLLALALFLIYKVWYPTPMIKATGVMKIYIFILAIDLILGPTLTAIVYKRRRLEFLFNLSVIVILQLSAFFYGFYVVERGRPAFMVFVVDDIELVSPIDVETEKLPANVEYHVFSKPQWVGSTYSNDEKIAFQQKQDEIVHGIMLSHKAENYQNLKNVGNQILTKLQALDELNKFNSKESVDAKLKQYSLAVGWLPVKSPEVDMVALFDKHGYPIAVVDLRPWK